MYIWKIITKWTCLHNQHPEEMGCTSPPEPPFVRPSVLLTLLSAGTSSWLLAPSAGFACICISYRQNLQDVLFWGCSITPHYASRAHPCWTIQTFIVVVVCPSSLLWHALWVCTAISVLLMDVWMVHPDSCWTSADTSVLCPGDTCMHFFWVNSHPRVGVLRHRIWVSSTLIDSWHPTANFLIFFLPPVAPVAPCLHGHCQSVWL